MNKDSSVYIVLVGEPDKGYMLVAVRWALRSAVTAAQSVLRLNPRLRFQAVRPLPDDRRGTRMSFKGRSLVSGMFNAVTLERLWRGSDGVSEVAIERYWIE